MKLFPGYDASLRCVNKLPNSRMGSKATTRRRVFDFKVSSIAEGPPVRHLHTEVPESDNDEVLDCPTLRHKLKPRLSPFRTHNNFGAGFVSEDDRVALSSLKFASVDSAGASGCIIEYDEEEEEIFTGNGSLPYLSRSQDKLCIPLPPWAIRAGARQEIYFEPADTRVAIVTCGGLCPGLNDVIQGLVNKCQDYGVPEGNVLGIRYGFKGFYDRKHKPIVLTKRSVEGIHLEGGTILGTSRGGADLKKIVKQIDLWGIDMCFVVGGNGGNAGAAALQVELDRAEVTCAVIGVPKSIDNDILLIDKCFGFDTAVEEAQRALISAKVEASSAYRGVGLVKVMGRSSGFIALNASLASGVVDVVLIPEVPFKLEGPHGLFEFVEKVIADRGHAVICIAEGAGQDLVDGTNQGTDASGNPVLKDIGIWLRDRLKKGIADVDVKYIDPSYLIRSIPTTSNDRIYTKILAENSCHAAFAGYTGVMAGLVNTHYVYLPIPVVIQQPRRVDPKGKQWGRLRAAIGQPDFF